MPDYIAINDLDDLQQAFADYVGEDSVPATNSADYAKYKGRCRIDPDRR